MPLLLDPVEQVIANLQNNNSSNKTSSSVNTELSQETIRKCQSAFRTMRIHNRPGCFGRHDHDLTRAAALLEYVVRETEGTKIPIKTLAQASFLKLANFQKLHQLVGNFLVNTSASKLKRSSLLSASNHNNSSSSSGRHKLLPSSIPSLAIKFGPYVKDPTGYASQAQDLFQKIEHHAKTQMASASDSRAQLYDLQQYQRAYEAACFYVVVTNTQKSSARQDHPDGDASEKSTLDLQTLLDASTDFTEIQFKHVYKYIEKLLEEFKQQQKKNKANKNKNKKRSSKEDNATTKGTAKGKNKRQRIGVAEASSSSSSLPAASIETAMSLLDRIDHHYDDSNDGQIGTQESSLIRAAFAPSFLNWKETILSKARKEAREAASQKQTEMNDSEAIAHAADAVLKRFGILQ